MTLCRKKITPNFMSFFLNSLSFVCSDNPYCRSVSELDNGLSTKIVAEQKFALSFAFIGIKLKRRIR